MLTTELLAGWVSSSEALAMTTRTKRPSTRPSTTTCAFPLRDQRLLINGAHAEFAALAA